MFNRNREANFRRTAEEAKKMARVLFIDDKKFETISILKENNWNVSHIEDVSSLEDAHVIAAHVICVDIRGVGARMKFRKEGLGLLASLKDKYPEKRFVVYSAEKRGDRFANELELADKRLPKDAEPSRFMDAMQELAVECFSWESCVARIAREFAAELPPGWSRAKVESTLVKSLRKQEFDVNKFVNLTGGAFSRTAELSSIMSLLIRV